MDARSDGVVVVVGAGVIGLSTALLFMAEQPRMNLVIIAEHGPDEDPSIHWCSPHAGACQDAYSSPCFPSGDISMRMFRELEAKGVPGLRTIENRDYFAADDEKYQAIKRGEVAKKPSLRKFRTLDEDELIPDTIYGESYEIVMIDPVPYLRYLLQQFIFKGGLYVKTHLKNLSDIPALIKRFHPNLNAPQAIINCSGFGSKSLHDVKDNELHYSRGQYCDIFAPLVNVSKGEWHKNWFITVFPLTNGKVRIGATRELDDSEQEIRKETLDWQLEKAIRLEPKLIHGSSLHHCTTTIITSISNEEREVPPGKPIIMDVLVGRRPTRVIDGQKVGPRIEIESKELIKDCMIIHNYGHSTMGFQTSWDSARIVINLYNERQDSILKTR